MLAISGKMEWQIESVGEYMKTCLRSQAAHDIICVRPFVHNDRTPCPLGSSQVKRLR
jgi:hypothetical protein